MRKRFTRLLTLSLICLLSVTLSLPAAAFPPGATNPPGGEGSQGAKDRPRIPVSEYSECRDARPGDTRYTWVRVKNGRVVEMVRNAAACPRIDEEINKRTGESVKRDCSKVDCYSWTDEYSGNSSNYRDYPFCHRGYFVWYFYGTTDDPTMYRSRTWVPNQEHCRIEDYIFPTPHPMDGGADQNYLNSLGWVSTGPKNGKRAVNYPQVKYREGRYCGRAFEDNAYLKDRYFSSYPQRPATEPGPGATKQQLEAYADALTAAAVKAAFWSARDNLIGQLSKKGLPLSMASVALNSKPTSNPPTFWNYDRKPSPGLSKTVQYGDGYPCSSPLDFAYNAKSTGERNKLGNATPVFGVCWVGVGQEYVRWQNSKDSTRQRAQISNAADPFFYTRRSWINPGDSDKPDIGATGPVVNAYRQYLKNNLPGSVPQPDSSVTRNTISREAKRWDLNAGTRITIHRWTPEMIANEATCHYGAGQELKEIETKRDRPVLRLEATKVTSGQPRTYVAGKEVNWTVTFQRGDLRCIAGDCKGIVNLSNPTTSWKTGATYPREWTECVPSQPQRRIDCDYVTEHTERSNGSILAVTSNYYTATRQRAAITYWAQPTASVFWVPSYSKSLANVCVFWFFTTRDHRGNQAGMDTCADINPGGASGGEWIHVTGTQKDFTVRVGGPYLDP